MADWLIIINEPRPFLHVRHGLVLEEIVLISIGVRGARFHLFSFLFSGSLPHKQRRQQQHIQVTTAGRGRLCVRVCVCMRGECRFWHIAPAALLSYK